MEEKAHQIAERLLNYGVEVIKLTTKLAQTAPGNVIAKQILRSGTSIGANYEEACGAQSKADFVHKLQIVLKEIRETSYWLKLIQRSEIIKEPKIEGLILETQQLSNIIAKSIITAKRGKCVLNIKFTI